LHHRRCELAHRQLAQRLAQLRRGREKNIAGVAVILLSFSGELSALLAFVKLIAEVLQAVAVDAVALLDEAMQLGQGDVGRTQVRALAPACLASYDLRVVLVLINWLQPACLIHQVNGSPWPPMAEEDSNPFPSERSLHISAPRIAGDPLQFLELQNSRCAHYFVLLPDTSGFLASLETDATVQWRVGGLS
jgi:hypothetical protein